MDPRAPILIAEDDENDALIVKRALRDAGVTCPVHFCKDGVQVRSYLRHEEPYSDRNAFVLPWLLIFDLKMTRMDGLELLKWMRGYSGCGFIPTIVLSASRQTSDVEDAYRLGVNSYLVKPSCFQTLVEMMKLALRYWSMCEKPPLKQLV